MKKLQLHNNKNKFACCCGCNKIYSAASMVKINNQGTWFNVNHIKGKYIELTVYDL